MKILFVAPGMRFGGAERVMSILANRWVQHGIEVRILLSGTAAESYYSLDDKIELISIYGDLKNKKCKPLAAIREIKKLCKEWQPDVALCFYNDLCALTAIALSGLNIPVLYSERNDPTRTNQRKIDKIYRKIVESRCDGVVFQTEGAKSCYPVSVQKKSRVIVNPVDISKIPFWDERKEDKFIISVGRLTSQKRQDILIEAFSKIADKYPEYQLRIYGTGELKESLQKQIEKAQLRARIELCGTEPNVLAVVAKSSLFVLSSDYEGIPNVLVEAMAIGVPCVSTDCSPGGARMFLQNGVNGYLVPCADVDSLASAMAQMLEDRRAACSFGRAALEIRNQIDVEKVSQKWLDFISTCIKK